MKLGVVSRIGEFPREFWNEEFEVFGKNGVEVSHIELIVNYPYLGPSDYNKKDIKLLRKYAEYNRVDLILHLLPNQRNLSTRISKNLFSSSQSTQEFVEHQKRLYDEVFNIGSLTEEVRRESMDEIKLSLEMARKLGAKLIIIHGGNFSNLEYQKEHLKASRKTLEELNPYFTDVKLCVENIPTIGHANDKINEYPKTFREINYLTNALKNIGVCFDVGHANVFGDVLDFYEKIKRSGKIWDLHLHDNNGNKDDHLEIGRGNVPFKELFERLKIDNYLGYYSIELDTWCRNKMEKEERIRGLKYLRRLI